MNKIMQLIQKILQKTENRLSGRTIDLKPKKQKRRKSVIVKPTGRYARRMRRRKSA